MKITVFEDPYTMSTPEGVAELIRKLYDSGDGILERWLVKFEGDPPVERWIKTQALRHKPGPPERRRQKGDHRGRVGRKQTEGEEL